MVSRLYPDKGMGRSVESGEVRNIEWSIINQRKGLRGDLKTVFLLLHEKGKAEKGRGKKRKNTRVG